ncbi:MAG TPA: translation initiation factor IF-2 [bacterium]|nr:translation initiation factor IF-2 [bacterium]
MAKITVEAAAKRLGMDPDSCLKRLQEMGMLVRDQLDQIDLETFRQVKARLEEEKMRAQSVDAHTSKRIGSRVIRRRRIKTSEADSAADIDEGAEAEAAAEPEEIPAPESQPVVAAEESTQEVHVASEPVAEPEPQIEEPPQAEAALEAADVPPAPPTEEPAAQVEAPAEETLEAGRQQEPQVERREGRKPRRKKGAEGPRLKKVQIREVTHEPAKIISKPAIPIESLKPPAEKRPAAAKQGQPQEEARPGEAAPPKPEGEGRGRKGRRVVDFAQRGRKKEDIKREMGFLRNRRQKRKKGVKQTEITTPKAIKRKIKIGEQIQVGELAKRMGVRGGDLIKKLMSLGMMLTIVHDIDFETAVILASEFGYEIERATAEVEDLLQVVESRPEDMESRPPVVTIMGHVDHGKTTLLDAIRETDVASGEAGGITQHIGAYSVTLPNGRQITFVDTPGHESFAAMRARGAHVTDIVILVVAADDGVMPQTIESINHAKEAGVAIVVAVNKIDKDNANIERITRQLMEYGLIPENLGGDTLFTQISAKRRKGIEDLLDSVLLQAEMMELQANPSAAVIAVVLDARLERGRGPVADVLIKEGTLKKGMQIVADTQSGRVRMMLDDHGNEMAEALPGMPAQVIGLDGVPSAGSILNAVEDEKKAKAIVQLRSNQARSEEQKKRANLRLEDLFTQMKEGDIKELKIVLKGDVQGSVEAVRESLEKIEHPEVKVRVIHSGVGTITETDVNFASASNAIIIGFNVRPEVKSKESAEQQKVDIKIYNVIYELLNDVRLALQGMLAPQYQEVLNGVAEVRDTFHISRVGTVAGCMVLDGKIIRNSQVRLVRDGKVIYTGSLGSLKRFKDDTKEVATGFECGMNIDGYNDIKLGDRIESFTMIEVKPTLD